MLVWSLNCPAFLFCLKIVTFCQIGIDHHTQCVLSAEWVIPLISTILSTSLNQVLYMYPGKVSYLVGNNNSS